MWDWFKKKTDPGEGQRRTPNTILVIDDDATTLKIIERTLTGAGHRVLTAACGEDGLKTAQESNPDVIITDVIMPGMDGFMLFKELKRDEDTRDKSVLVLSARQNVGDTFRRFGADSFLTKPVEPQRLLEEIERLLKK